MEIIINLKVKWSGSDVIVTPIDPVIPIDLIQDKPDGYLTLEDFGGNPYYKRIDYGLTYTGSIVESINPIFSQEDLGKEFCGLFANKNPQEINYEKIDEYYPNILGSRYSKIIEVISSTKIKLDFEYNVGSNKAYIFFDNSFAYKKLMNQYVVDGSIGVWLSDNKTYVVRNPITVKLPNTKDFIIETSGKAYLKLGVEDYFKWNKNLGSILYGQVSNLFEIGISDKNFTSKNIAYLPPHRRVAESSPVSLAFFGGGMENIGEQSRTLSIIGNTALDEKREIGNNITDEIFYSIGLGFINAGGTYTGDGSKITDDIKDYLTVYIKNFEHEGAFFSDFKANMGGGLLLKAEDVSTEFLDESKYSPTSVKMKGRFTTDYSGIPINDKSFYPSHLLEITSNHSWYQTSDDASTRGWNNSQELVHIDRFVFWLPSGNYFKFLYEKWFNKGIKTDWYVESNNYNFFTGKKSMMHYIPKVGQKYWIGRKYNQEGRIIKENIPNQVKGMVNWAAVQGVDWDQVTNIPENASPIQLQPSDRFKIVGSDEVYTVLQTEREVHPLFIGEVKPFGGHDSVVSYFPVYTIDKDLPTNLPVSFEIEMIQSSAEYLLDGEEFDFYSVYKSNKFLVNHTKDTTFGEENILESNPYGHVSYNHSQVSIWAKNWNHRGYYRQSENNYSNFPSHQIPEGKTEALRRFANISTFINCQGFNGEFNPASNYIIREKIYKSLGMVRPETENVRLYGCTNMNGLENRNDEYVINLPREQAPNLK